MNWRDARAKASGWNALRARARWPRRPPSVRVRVASQPTFVRYVFDVPEQTAVTADRAKDRLTLTFDAPITFDLADAEAAQPPSVASINAEAEQDSTLVRFGFLSKVDVRTFRDGKSYNVDVVIPEQKPRMHGEGAEKPPTVALETAPSEKPPVEEPHRGLLQRLAAAFEEKPEVAAPATVAAKSPAASTAPVPADFRRGQMRRRWHGSTGSEVCFAGGETCFAGDEACFAGDEACSAGGEACSAGAKTRFSGGTSFTAGSATSSAGSAAAATGGTASPAGSAA